MLPAHGPNLSDRLGLNLLHRHALTVSAPASDPLSFPSSSIHPSTHRVSLVVQGGDCPPSPPRSLAEKTTKRTGFDGATRVTDWWGLPDDGMGLRVAGETWCGECLVLVGAGSHRCRYQWQRVSPLGSVESIPGARGPRYVVSEEDMGRAIQGGAGHSEGSIPATPEVMRFIGSHGMLRFACSTLIPSPVCSDLLW